MRFANVGGRLALVTRTGVIDVERTSGGALPASPAAALGVWADVLKSAASADGEESALDESALLAPSPEPRRVCAIGLNYAPHATESGLELPKHPFAFTKTAAAVTGPFGDLVLTTDTVDWEVEIVAIIGRRAENVSAEDAWSHVAGLTVGQDYSDREVQNRLGANSQPTLGKSRLGFAPTGPYLVTPDEFADPDDLELATVINGQDVQRARSADLIFDIPTLVAYLSAVLPLFPGDLIFTGTPAGVGIGQTPPKYLTPGDVIESTVEGVGTIRQTAVVG